MQLKFGVFFTFPFRRRLLFMNHVHFSLYILPPMAGVTAHLRYVVVVLPILFD
jgi:hypothetical protein